MITAMVPRTDGSIRPKIPKPGMPKPIRYSTTIIGMPRIIVVYNAARARSGNSTGLLLVRTNAINVAKMDTPTNAMASTLIFSHNPFKISGNDETKYSAEKNVSLTRGQPGDIFKPMTMIATNTIVLIRLVTTDCNCCFLRYARRASSTSLT